MRTAYFEIGRILSPKGLAGELRIYPLTDDPSRFTLLDEVLVEFPPSGTRGREAHNANGDRILRDRPDREAVPAEHGARYGRIYPVEAARVHNGLVFLKLAGVGDAAAAERLRGALVKIPPEKALPLGEGEYYIRDLIGLEVVTDAGEILGTLTEVLRTGANDVYVVGGKLMIPAIRECVLDVDIDEKRMTVSLTEGLREL